MRRRLLLTFVLFLSLSALSSADIRGRMDAKVGDQIYVCNMGETCPCDTMAMKPGICKCGKELIQTNVIKVEDESIYVASRKRGFDRVGKYACACGESCNCGTVSKKLGKCVCGTEMKEVKGD